VAGQGKRKKEKSSFEMIRKPPPPPGQKFGKEKPDEKARPSLRGTKYKKKPTIDDISQ
jgi:hypothetical protein